MVDKTKSKDVYEKAYHFFGDKQLNKSHITKENEISMFLMHCKESC